MKDTIQISIAVSNEQVKEQLVARLSAIEYDAFEEKDDELVAFIDESKFDEALLNTTLSTYGVKYTKAIIEEQNWNAVWESNFDPVIVDDFCAIRADFHQPFTQTMHEIVITPKMSFGTGHHATTYMMIREMSKLDFNNKVVADFGTGTGVLAILAEKLGSQRVWAIDMDDWSIENATENIGKNNCRGIIIEKANRFNAVEKFDIILANINKNVILASVDDLQRGIKSQGQLLLSGLLKEDESEVVSAFVAKGYIHLSTIERTKWICLLLQYAGNSK